jgi:hypothetical protein
VESIKQWCFVFGDEMPELLELLLAPSERFRLLGFEGGSEEGVSGRHRILLCHRDVVRMTVSDRFYWLKSDERGLHEHNNAKGQMGSQTSEIDVSSTIKPLQDTVSSSSKRMQLSATTLYSPQLFTYSRLQYKGQDQNRDVAFK